MGPFGDEVVGLERAEYPLESPPLGLRLLQLMLQDGRLLYLMGNEKKGSSSKQVVGRDEEIEFAKALEVDGWSEGEEFCFAIIPNKFVEFNSFLGLAMVGFEKEISTLLKKMESRKGCGDKASRGSRKSSSSCLEREIRKLDCSMNYNGVPLAVRGKRGSNKGFVFFLRLRSCFYY